MAHEPTDETPARPPSRSLQPWERSLAGLLGTAAAGAGTVAVFVTENQVGTASLFVLAIALLLMGVQGTPITRFGLGEKGSVEYADAVAQDLVQASQEAPTPDVAQAYLDAAVRVSPAVALSATTKAVAYETLVMRALEDVAGPTEVQRLSRDDGVDFVVRTSATGRVSVIVKYFEHSAGAAQASQLRRVVERRTATPLLIVANSIPSRVRDEVQNFNQEPDHAPVVAVQWNGPSDNPSLQSALQRLRSAGQ